MSPPMQRDERSLNPFHGEISMSSVSSSLSNVSGSDVSAASAPGASTGADAAPADAAGGPTSADAAPVDAAGAVTCGVAVL